MKTQPWPAHRSTGKRGSTATLLTQTNTNIRNANTPRMHGLKATASLTWWRKGPIRKETVKTMRQGTSIKQMITSWQSSLRNLVGSLNPISHIRHDLFSKSRETICFFLDSLLLLVFLGLLQVSTVWCSMTPSWSPPTLTMFLWRQKPTGWPKMPWKPLRFLASSAGCPSVDPLLYLQGTHSHTHTQVV